MNDLLNSAKRRLRHSIDRLNAAANEYSDLDSFIREVNGTLEELRKTTYHLQKKKKAIPGFDLWYKEWQDWLKQNKYTKWAHDNRNMIVHREDFIPKSKLTVKLMESYQESKDRLLTVNLEPTSSSQKIAEYVKGVLQFSRGTVNHGLIEINRKWIVEDLDDSELIGVLGYVVNVMSALVCDCFMQLLHIPDAGQAVTSTTEILDALDRSCVSDFELQSEYRTSVYRLDTGELCNIEYKNSDFKINQSDWEGHYDKSDLHKIDVPDGSQYGTANCFMQIARMVMNTDGVHYPMLFMMQDGKLIKNAQVDLSTHSTKLLAMKKLAVLAVELDADGVIMVGESWFSPLESIAPGNRAEDSLQRKEILTVYSLHKSGELVVLACDIGRVDGQPLLGMTKRIDSPLPYFLEPFIEKWKEK